MGGTTTLTADRVARAAIALHGGANDYDALLELIGDARLVLLGESTHGTHEFYAERARITRRLIDERGFAAVAVEADWPDACQVMRYVCAPSATPPSAASGWASASASGRATLPGYATHSISTAEDHAGLVAALDGFVRFPCWMWRNADVVDFIAWLRARNARLDPGQQAGFYGLDLYSLFKSIDEVLRYLDEVDPRAAADARQCYACFSPYQQDSQHYGYATGFGMASACDGAVAKPMHLLAARTGAYLQAGSHPDACFNARQNAQLAYNAELYYRTMFRSRVASWNIRDRHMAATLDALLDHLSGQRGAPAKVVVWEHNSHVGDARATESGRLGELNLGQLVRERYGDSAFLVGLTTYQGYVTAATRWDGLAERKQVRPALRGSYEALFHQSGLPRFLLPLGRHSDVGKALGDQHMLERAIGVLYLQHSERQSHYFNASLASQFDAVIHIDETDAVQPLDTVSRGPGGEAPETYPVGV